MSPGPGRISESGLSGWDSPWASPIFCAGLTRLDSDSSLPPGARALRLPVTGPARLDSGGRLDWAHWQTRRAELTEAAAGSGSLSYVGGSAADDGPPQARAADSDCGARCPRPAGPGNGPGRQRPTVTTRAALPAPPAGAVSAAAIPAYFFVYNVMNSRPS